MSFLGLLDRLDGRYDGRVFGMRVPGYTGKWEAFHTGLTVGSMYGGGYGGSMYGGMYGGSMYGGFSPFGHRGFGSFYY